MEAGGGRHVDEGSGDEGDDAGRGDECSGLALKVEMEGWGG
jgi:hypothetical protein